MTKRMRRRSAEHDPTMGDARLDTTRLESLASTARSAEDHEAYHLVAKSDRFRIGLVAVAGQDAPATFRIEVLLQVLARNTRPRIDDLERMNAVLDTLSNRGYSLDHHDGCWVLCERAVAPEDIEGECEAVMAIARSKEDERTGC